MSIALRKNLPPQVRFFYDYLTTYRFSKPRISNPDDIKVFSWVPLLGFIYGEHAVLSRHNALLFKPQEYVAVALVIEKTVPDIRIRIRSYAKNEALNYFLNETMDDFDAITEHEDADYSKFGIIEKLIEKYIHKNANILKEAIDITGICKLIHISYLRPGSGLNWSGSSAIAISSAIHKHYFRSGKYFESDIRKLAYAIELIYQEGRASGYGFALFSENNIISYSLKDEGKKKLEFQNDLRKAFKCLKGNEENKSLSKLLESFFTKSIQETEGNTIKEIIDKAFSGDHEAKELLLEIMLDSNFLIYYDGSVAVIPPFAPHIPVTTH